MQEPHLAFSRDFWYCCFFVCFPGPPEGGSLQGQVLGIHVWAKHSSNIPLSSLSLFPHFFFFFAFFYLSFHRTFIEDGFLPVLQKLPLIPLGMLSSRFLFPIHPLSLPLSALVLHPHRYGNKQLQLPPASQFFFSLPLSSSCEKKRFLVLLLLLFGSVFALSCQNQCFLCLVAKVKLHIWEQFTFTCSWNWLLVWFSKN